MLTRVVKLKLHFTRWTMIVISTGSHHWRLYTLHSSFYPFLLRQRMLCSPKKMQIFVNLVISICSLVSVLRFCFIFPISIVYNIIFFTAVPNALVPNTLCHAQLLVYSAIFWKLKFDFPTAAPYKTPVLVFFSSPLCNLPHHVQSRKVNAYRWITLLC